MVILLSSLTTIYFLLLIGMVALSLWAEQVPAKKELFSPYINIGVAGLIIITIISFILSWRLGLLLLLLTFLASAFYFCMMAFVLDSMDPWEDLINRKKGAQCPPVSKDSESP